MEEVSRVWPFEIDGPGASHKRGRIVHAEVWPSLVQARSHAGQVKDERQVGNLALNLRDLDRRQALMALFAAGISPIAKEEGWILGVEPDPHAEGRARHGDS